MIAITSKALTVNFLALLVSAPSQGGSLAWPYEGGLVRRMTMLFSKHSRPNLICSRLLELNLLDRVATNRSVFV